MSKNYQAKRINPCDHNQPKTSFYQMLARKASQKEPILDKFHSLDQLLQCNRSSTQFQHSLNNQPSKLQVNGDQDKSKQVSSHSLLTATESSSSKKNINVIEELSSSSQDSKGEEELVTEQHPCQSTQIEHLKKDFKAAIKDSEFKKFLKNALRSQERLSSQTQGTQEKEGTSQTTTHTQATDEERKGKESQVSFSDKKFQTASYVSKITPNNALQSLEKDSQKSEEFEHNLTKSAPPPAFKSQTTPQFGQLEQRGRNLSVSREVKGFNEERESSSDEQSKLSFGRFSYDDEKDSFVKCTEFEKNRGKSIHNSKVPLNAKGRIGIEVPLSILRFQIEQSKGQCFECALYTMDSTWGNERDSFTSQTDSDSYPKDDDDWYTDEELEDDTSELTYENLQKEIKRNAKKH